MSNLPQKVPSQGEQIYNKLLSEDGRLTLKKIAARILRGLKINEACILSGLDKEEINILLSESEGFNDYVELQKLKFKEKQLAVLADSNNVKTAQWFLEVNEPETYGPSAKKSSGGDGESHEHVVHAIIKTIQRSDDPLVKTRDVEYQEKTKVNDTDARPSRAAKKAGSVLD